MAKVKTTAEEAAKHIAKKIKQRFNWATENTVFVYSPEISDEHGFGKCWTIEWEGMVDWAGEISWYSMNSSWMGIKIRINTDKIKLLPNSRNALNFINIGE